MLLVLFAVVVGVAVVVTKPSTEPGGAQAAGASSSVVRQDSHVLDEAGEGAPVLVEFLDFECEACGAFFPIVEDMREQFAGEITYVVRYFPLPGHKNSMTAALAVEAAAQQGKLQQMYSTMYERQTQWGEKQTSQASVFRGYAQELGLDMAAYDRAVASPATKARVEKDYKAGLEAGVEGTPTFFLNDTRIQPHSYEDLAQAFDQALAEN